MAETGFNAVQLGDTIPGTDSSGGLVNASLLGTIKRFDNLALTAGDSVKALRSQGPVWGVLLRNLSGGALLGKRLALCKQTAGYSIIEAASGYGAALYDAPVVAIGPWPRPRWARRWSARTTTTGGSRRRRRPAIQRSTTLPTRSSGGACTPSAARPPIRRLRC